jgi:hypothetical protein
MSWNDPEYFRGRAAAERLREAASADDRVAAIHRELAERYEQLVSEQSRPTLKVVGRRVSQAA